MSDAFTDALIADFAQKVRARKGIEPVIHKPFSVQDIPSIEQQTPKKRAPSKAKRQAVDSLAAELKEKRKQARRDLAEELRSARKRLRLLRTHIVQAEFRAEDALQEAKKEARSKYAALLRSAKKRLKLLREEHVRFSEANYQPVAINGEVYPAIPAPAYKPTPDAVGIPAVPGIYFLWDEGIVDYVGQSINLSGRLRLGLHHVLHSRHRISILPVERRELSWTEAYYIGFCRAPKNFGRAASHYEKQPCTSEKADGRPADS